MPAPTEAVFFADVASLTVHVLDAVHRAEWRYFFDRPPLRDETADRVFTGLHPPPFVVVRWGLSFQPFEVGVDAFVLAHAGVHLLPAELVVNATAGVTRSAAPFAASKAP